MFTDSNSGESQKLPYECDFEKTEICEMTQPEDEDDFDWTRHTGRTPTGGTGPDEANKNSYFMYTEASNTGDRDKA